MFELTSQSQYLLAHSSTWIPSGWLPVPRWATTAQFRAASREGATREGAGGPVHPGTRMGTFLYE